MLRVRTVWSGVGGAPYYSNHYFNAASGVPEANACITAVDNFWTAIAAGIYLNATYIIEGDVPFLNPADGEIGGVLNATGNAGAGSGTGEPLPPANQVLIKWSTATFIGGRRLVGRTFIPTPVEAVNVIDGSLQASYRATIIAAGNVLIGSGTNFSVWSRTHGVVAPVVTNTVNQKFSLLRSRRD